MAKKKKQSINEDEKAAEAKYTAIVEEKIGELVAKNGTKLTEEERKAQINAFKEIFLNGKTPLEALGLNQDFLKLLYKQAYDQYNLGLYKDANHVFRILCLFEPNSPKYQMGLAATNHQMGNYEIAATIYWVSWYCDMMSPIPFFYMSDCYMKLGQYEVAYVMLRMSAEVCGQQPQYAKLKTRIYRMMKGLRKDHGIHQEEEESTSVGGDIFSKLQATAEEKNEDIL